KFLGKADTKVTLTVEREGVDKPFDVTITRASIELETVSGFRRNKDDNWDYVIDAENRILYVRLTGFAGNTARDLRRVLDAASRQGIKGLVLDLRFNPGGLLRSAVAISDMFIDQGDIVAIRPRVGESEVHKGQRGGFLDFPIVCLVNGGSASASEIVSACLQDHKRAVIVGERSFGKGSVQNIHPFDGGQLKLTIASFWRPSGKNLNKASTKGRDDDVWGVTPDVLVKLSRAERDQLAEYQLFTEVIQRTDIKPKTNDFKDRQLETALEEIRNRIKLAAEQRLKKAS
ncbi:MAG: S41 family peptidase, partial [Gemmataceae bacterium]